MVTFSLVIAVSIIAIIIFAVKPNKKKDNNYEIVPGNNIQPGHNIQQRNDDDNNGPNSHD